MTNPLADIPLNIKRVYVMATARESCEVYMPVDSFEEQQQILKKAELQIYLDSQPTTPAPKSYA